MSGLAPLELDLVAIHVPKCGGISLQAEWKRIYGSALALDYGDHVTDPSSPVNMDPEGWREGNRADFPRLLTGKRAVFGHFNAGKYRLIPARRRVALVRDPLARLLSHYYYWLTMPRGPNRLHAYVLDKKLSLEEFARLPMVRFFYTRVYFETSPPADFDYIGNFENMAASIARLSAVVGHEIHLPFANRNDSKDYRENHDRIMSDADLSRRLRDLLADDIRFYDLCRERWG